MSGSVADRSLTAFDIVTKLSAGMAPTGAFFSSSGALVAKIPDRLFVGAAAANDGASPNVLQDWLSGGAAYQLSWPVYGATAAILSPVGQIALVSASRASDLSSSYGSLQTTIGAASIAINDDVFATSGRHCTVYGHYFEAQTQPGSSGISFIWEGDAVNFGAVTAQPQPYHILNYGCQGGAWIASGGEHTGVNDAAFGLGFKDNGAKFQAGIVFGNNALTGCDGTTGFGYAISLAKGHMLQWYDPTGAASAAITSTIATAANAISLQFQDGGVSFLNASGTIAASIQHVASAVNGLAITPSAATQAVALTAFGSDANVQINLAPKGTGIVWAPGTVGVGGSLTVSGSAVFSGSVTVGGQTLMLLHSTPANSAAAGGIGNLATDGTYLYVSTGASTWKRLTLSSY